MTEFTIYFQRGTRVGTRCLRMETVEADTALEAEIAAKRAFPEFRSRGYEVVRIDYFEKEFGRLTTFWQRGQ